MQQTERKTNTKAKPIALVCGVLGVLAAIWAYWMILPGVLLGAVAVVLGWFIRRDGDRESGSVAMTLGVIAIFLVPSVLFIANDAENWGRDCALDPTHDPNC